MSDRFYGSRYGKHSTYYGMNDSSLYGSNFSSVFADAPPPLEDFHEEDDDMVFRYSGKSSPENGETTAVKVKSETKSVSPDTEFKWVSNGNRNRRNDEEFGDFSGFADFKSAFSTSSCNSTEKEEWFGEPNNELTPSGTDGNVKWPGASRAEPDEANDIDSKKVKEQSTCANDYSVDAVDDDDDDFADFEGFDDAENQKNNFAFGAVSRDSEIENSCPSSPLSPIFDMSNSVLPPKFNKKSIEDNETQLSNNHDNFSDKDLASSGAELSDEKSLVQSESKSSLSDMPRNGFVGSECKNNKSNQRDLQINGINKRGDDEDDFGTFMSTRSLSPDNDFDAFAMENSDHQVDCCKERASSSLEQRDKTDQSNKPLPEYDDFGEFSAVKTQYPSVDFPSSEESTCSSKFRPFESKEKQSISDSGDDLQFLSNEKDLVSKTLFKGDLDLPNVQSQSQPNDFKTSLNLVYTEKPEKIDKHSSSANENSMDNEEQIDETDEFGDFAAVSKSVDGLGAGRDEQADRGPRDEEMEGTDERKTSIDSSNKITVGEKKENVKNTPEKVSGDNFDEMNSYSEESFGDFKVIRIDQKKPKQDGKPKNTDDDFGEFGTAEIDDFGDFKATANDQELEKCDEKIKRQDSDSGEFGASANDKNSKDDKNSYENDEFGDFSTSSDKSFGNFSVFKHEESIANTLITDNNFSKTADADDFGSFSSVESKSDNFADSTTTSETGDWANFSASKPNSVSDHDNFGGFSSSGTGTAVSVEFATISSSNGSSTFGSFGSSGVKDKTHKEKREQTDSRSGTRHSHIQKTEPKSAASGSTWSAVPHKSGCDSVFKPGSKVVMLQAGKPLVAAFASLGHLSGRGMQINSLGIRLSSSSDSEMWKEIQLSERNGSLRFQWLSCHSQYKQLLSLDVVPDSLPVTSLLTPGGDRHKNMLPFMAGPGFVVEPSSGPVTSFRSGVKDVDPSQDPFGAPPEVGLPDLSFGFSNSKYPDFKPANHNSGSMALDLDFLATPSTPELASKQEHKSIYDEDLLGLDMQFSLDPQGQFKLPSAPNTPSPKSMRVKDSRKVFKFGNVTIPLAPQDSEQELSNKAKEIVKEIEDLSFMLSSVLMFPLKSR